NGQLTSVQIASQAAASVSSLQSQIATTTGIVSARADALPQGAEVARIAGRAGDVASSAASAVSQLVSKVPPQLISLVVLLDAWHKREKYNERFLKQLADLSSEL